MSAMPLMTTETLPPQSLEAEISVLGACLLNEDALSLSMEKLKPEDFYRDSHRKIFQAIASLKEKQVAVDLVTLGEALKGGGELEAVGGPAALAALTDGVPSAGNVEYYVEIVRRKSLLRRLIKSATQIAQECYQNPEDADLLLDKAENVILEVGKAGSVRPVVALRDLMHGTIMKIDELRSRKVHVTGVPTGFAKLDEITAGMQKGELIIVAARPGMGKTALCLNMARHAAGAKVPVAIFSLEMTADSLLMRLLSSEAAVDGSNLRSGHISQEAMAKLTRAASILYEMPIYVDDSSMLDIQTVRAKSRRLMKEKNIGLIIVDYLQMLTSASRSENRVQEISTISRQLKGLAKELGIPVIAASQLNRGAEQRGGRTGGGDSRPRLSDLRESGAIEQDADVVMLIYRKSYYKREEGGGQNDEDDKSAEIIIAKQRSGPVGSVTLVFQDQYARFVDAAPGQFGGGPG
jgi:replicative DNA helicase